MPEMHFNVRWPNGAIDRCYSPSYVIEEHLEVGGRYPVRQFLARSALALNIASERVRAKYGFACSSALEQLRAIEDRVRSLSPSEADGVVEVLAFEKHEARDARTHR